ncbi:Transmembrane protein [Sarcoptes scabiei]|uniref:Transmembrane protein n=1 Tax=Sarcoptes scabiei TaxID=52283 RepID=A0A834R6E4_SARSC|nr:Transmembrane protein [Sarcoptes scabiei]
MQSFTSDMLQSKKYFISGNSKSFNLLDRFDVGSEDNNEATRLDDCAENCTGVHYSTIVPSMQKQNTNHRHTPSISSWSILLLFSIPLFTINICLNRIDAKVIEGVISTDKDWIFLTRFCFLSKEGIFEYNVSYPKSFAPQNLLLYFDAKSQWPAVYKQNKTCEQKESVLIDDFNQIINLTEFQRDYKATTASGCKLIPNIGTNNESWYRCIHHRTFQSHRERWWFIAIDNCGTSKGLYMKYRITMTNSQTNAWLKHFSADEFYILHTDLIMCILFWSLLGATCFEAYALYTRHLFHKTYKFYMASLMTECIGLFFQSIYYGIYAQKGYANILYKLIGKAFESSSTLIFILLLLLISKGYTITRARLKPKTVTKFTMFMVMSVIGYMIIFYHEQYLFDPGEVLYMYESHFGYLLISLRLLAWSWFSYAIVFTLIHYPQKSSFFAKLFLIYSVWFISAPILIFVATFVIPKWMREKIINAVETIIAFLAHLVFFVRTTQISIMEKSGTIESGTLEHFNNYKYAPSRPTPMDMFSITSAALINLTNSNGSNLHRANNLMFISANSANSNNASSTTSSPFKIGKKKKNNAIIIDNNSMSNNNDNSNNNLSDSSSKIFRIQSKNFINNNEDESKNRSLIGLMKSSIHNQRNIDSADSKLTSVTSLSNQSIALRNRLDQNDFNQNGMFLPEAEAD